MVGQVRCPVPLDKKVQKLAEVGEAGEQNTLLEAEYRQTIKELNKVE